MCREGGAYEDEPEWKIAVMVWEVRFHFRWQRFFFLMARVLRAEKTRQVIGRGFEDQK